MKISTLMGMTMITGGLGAAERYWTRLDADGDTATATNWQEGVR
ncbi:MAG TPA: hypothetical protein PLJ32_07010 [Kiritimatiellia bacterium]|jgi:hypothetical protein|nr:hypothetical protein [Kiritimatiellia bacterium]HPW75712.1 hypothetical protein [Kiritimatiellia bacterium]